MPFSAGLSVTWRIRGKDTCEYCKQLNGKSVSRGESMVKQGDELTPAGAEPFKVNSTKAHPPLHYKCDCYLSS